MCNPLPFFLLMSSSTPFYQITKRYKSSLFFVPIFHKALIYAYLTFSYCNNVKKFSTTFLAFYLQKAYLCSA